MKYIISGLVCLLAVAVSADFRNEFDRLLVSTTIEHMTKLEHRLLELQSEINHLTAFPTQAEKDNIVREMEMMIAFTEQAQVTMSRELKRTDLNLVEKINFESALKTSQVVAQNLKAFEVKVKAIKVGPAVTPKPAHPLHITVADFQALEKRLMELQGQINHLQTTKSKAEQEKIIKEIEAAIVNVNTNLPKLQAELKRKDLSFQDQVIFEVGVKLGGILVKDLKETEAKVKAIKTH